ncbi:PREDICTED: translation initiation factor IF-3, mitochondrial [Elephantulus edwardii]|uniref:translation initiation factor IF-3, mitochondrial n=1 Tax=Elephantulus edwardii TaxID=28737 RepID=UPI0003F08E17|nr:PREDICTED: translation initiation factor IF-3, mitochondrial [Elephantulus edwardii]
MAAGFLKTLTLQALKPNSICLARCLGRCLLQQTVAAQPAAQRLPSLICAEAFCTADRAQDAPKKKTKTDTAFTNVGRKISHRIIHVIDEKGNDLGNMHRANVIKLMDQRDLRLVQRDASAEPPKYQLMTGLQIHEERMQLRERDKASPKTGPTLIKELTFSSNIGQHDLATKSKQIQQWVEKKYHVQITVKKGKNVEESENSMEAVFNQIVQMMPGIATFLSKPQAVKGGRAMMAVLRHLSKKEEKEYRKHQEAQKGDGLSKDGGHDRPPDTVHQ